MLKNIGIGKKPIGKDISNLLATPGYYIIDEDESPYGELFKKMPVNPLPNDLSSIFTGDTTIPRKEQDEQKNLYKVIVGENILIQEIRTPAGVSRRITKKTNSSFLSTIRENNSTSVPLDEYTLYTQQKDLTKQKQLRPRGVQNNEQSLKEKCREYFHRVRGAGAPWNDNGPNVVYDDSNLRNNINTRVPIQKRDELAPRNGDVLFQGHLICRGIHSRANSIFLHWYNYSGCPGVVTILNGERHKRLIGVVDHGSWKRVAIGDPSLRLHVYGPGHQRASVYNAGIFHEPILVRSDLNWKRHYEPGPNPNDWAGGIGQDFFEAWGYVHGDDGDIGGGNGIQIQIPRGHSGSWVGISAHEQPEYVLNYDGGGGFNTIGSSRGYSITTTRFYHYGSKHDRDEREVTTTDHYPNGGCGIRALFYRDFR